jgi:hypothetical protein
VSGKQVIPAVVVHQVGGFAVDSQSVRLVVRVEAFSGLWIEFDLTDVPEVGAVDQPKPVRHGIQKDSRVDRVRILDSIGGSYDATLLPLVVRRRRVERLTPNHVYVSSGLRANVSGDIDVIAIADMDDVRCESSAWQRGSATPGPTVAGDQAGSTCAIGVVLTITLHNGRGIVNTNLTVERKRKRS